MEQFHFEWLPSRDLSNIAKRPYSRMKSSITESAGSQPRKTKFLETKLAQVPAVEPQRVRRAKNRARMTGEFRQSLREIYHETDFLQNQSDVSMFADKKTMQAASLVMATKKAGEVSPPSSPIRSRTAQSRGSACRSPSKRSSEMSRTKESRGSVSTSRSKQSSEMSGAENTQQASLESGSVEKDVIQEVTQQEPMEEEEAAPETLEEEVMDAMEEEAAPETLEEEEMEPMEEEEAAQENVEEEVTEARIPEEEEVTEVVGFEEEDWNEASNVAA